MVIILNISSFIWNAKTQQIPIITLRLCIAAFLFFSSLSLSSQNWNWIQVISGNGEMDLTNIATDNRNNTFISGTFTSSFSLQNSSYQSNGLADNYLLKLNDTGGIEWVITGGSEGNDSDGGICTDAQNALYWVGGFWLNGQYGEVQFNSTKSSKSLFIIKYNADGEVAWTKLIEGSNAKNSGSPTVDKAGNLYLAGSFSDSLFIDQELLVAQAREDFFVGKWNTNGQLIWLTHFGVEGLNRAIKVLINKNQEVLVGGTFKGRIAFPQDTINANTPDFDVFIAALDKNGAPLWLRKAGGVLEDSFSGMALDPADNLYVAGQYTGRLTLSEEVEITTDGFNENGYLLKYASTGEPLSAISIGGTSFETCTDILFDDQIVLSGFFEQELAIGTQQITGQGALSGYLLTMDTQFVATSLQDISSDNLLLINQINKTLSTPTLLIGGTFKGNAFFQEERYTSPDRFSLFIGAYTTDNTTAIPSSIPFVPDFQVYPNPSTHIVNIETTLPDYTVNLWNIQGQLLFTGKQTRSIPIEQLPDGIYLLELRNSTFTGLTRKIRKFSKGK